MAAPVAIPVIQRSPEWVEARYSGIGASEAPAAVGMSRWESPMSLWARKLRLVPEQEQSPAMLLGELMEPVLAELYERQTGERLRRRKQLLRHPEHAFMLASLDRVRTGRRIVELKHTASGQGYGEPGTDEVPDEVLVQVVHQMAVLDAPEADVAVLVGGRAPLRIYTIARDRRAEDLVIEEERAFWRHVTERTEPPVDGSEATARAIAERYPRDNGTELEAAADIAEALAALRDVRAAIDRHEQTERQLRSVIEDAMGEASVLVAPGIGRVTWKAQERRTVDWRAIALRAAADAGMAEEYLEDLAREHTTTKTARPFTPRWEDTPDG